MLPYSPQLPQPSQPPQAVALRPWPYSANGINPLTGGSTPLAYGPNDPAGYSSSPGHPSAHPAHPAHPVAAYSAEAGHAGHTTGGASDPADPDDPPSDVDEGNGEGDGEGDGDGGDDGHLVQRAAAKRARVPERWRSFAQRLLDEGRLDHKTLSELLFPALRPATRSRVLSALLAREALGDLYVEITVRVFASEDAADTTSAPATLEEWAAQTAQASRRRPSSQSSRGRQAPQAPQAPSGDGEGGHGGQGGKEGNGGY